MIPQGTYIEEELTSEEPGENDGMISGQHVIDEYTVMLYQDQDMQESGNAVSNVDAYDYERIRRVVLQVMAERESQTGMPVKEVPLEEIPKKKPELKKEDVLTSLDEDALSGIMASLKAFSVRRHIVGGTNCTLLSVATPSRLCRTGTRRRLSAA